MLPTYCVLSILCVGVVQGQRIVETEYGPVRGHTVNLNNGVEDTAVDVFYGVPFAKDTSGPLRFANPVPPDPWTTIFEADTIRDQCSQRANLVSVSHPDWEGFGEDCLHLNIYTPVNAQGPFYPVMFWIHGGGYTAGGSIQYPGHFLASRGVVVVNVNYRLGTFGFSYTANDACPGNAGMWDQHAGLQFVINNIANFGGDPSQITVFGESAGGSSTSLQMLSPHSIDLFQRAIVQSGAEDGVFPPEDKPEDYVRNVAQDLDCDLPDDYDMIDCLRQLSWEHILYNSSSGCTSAGQCDSMGPVVDGEGGFLPMMPAELRASGSVMDGPLMAGINEADAALFLPLLAPGTLLPSCCNRTYFGTVLERFVRLRPLSNQTEEDCYHALDYNYTPWPYIHDAEANRQNLAQMYTDYMFGVDWDRHIKNHQSVATTFGYLYDYQSINSTLPDWMGTVHAAEIDYLWGYPLLSYNPAVKNDSLFGDSRTYNDLDVQFTIFMQELWTNFAKYGHPTPSPVDNPAGGTTIWEEFTYDKMDLLYIGKDTIGTITEYNQKNYAFWSEYLNWMTNDDPSFYEGFPLNMLHDVSAVCSPEYMQLIKDGEYLADGDLV